jgi:serine/threonine protein kinase
VFLAMEYVEGDTLDAHLARARPAWREVVRLFLEAGRGLAAAHGAGLVHRDFKPSNVLVGRDGRVCVLDFGLARAVLRESGDVETERAAESAASGLVAVELTRMGVRAGTLGYMAPEQLAGAAAEPRSDQFAFCAALWEALCDGQPPFQGADFASLLAAIRAGAVRPPPAPSEVPAGVFALLERGLQAGPEQRHPDLRSLLEQLAALSLRRRASDREPANSGPPPAPDSKRLPARVRARLGRALIRAGQRLLPAGGDRERPSR